MTNIRNIPKIFLSLALIFYAQEACCDTLERVNWASFNNFETLSIGTINIAAADGGVHDDLRMEKFPNINGNIHIYIDKIYISGDVKKFIESRENDSVRSLGGHGLDAYCYGARALKISYNSSGNTVYRKINQMRMRRVSEMVFQKGLRLGYDLECDKEGIGLWSSPIHVEAIEGKGIILFWNDGLFVAFGKRTLP